MKQLTKLRNLIQDNPDAVKCLDEFEEHINNIKTNENLQIRGKTDALLHDAITNEEIVECGCFQKYLTWRLMMHFDKQKQDILKRLEIMDQIKQFKSKVRIIIKELEWIHALDAGGYGSYSDGDMEASPVYGFTYRVNLQGYCYTSPVDDNYYWIEIAKCDNMDEAKKLAQEHFNNLILDNIIIED